MPAVAITLKDVKSYIYVEKFNNYVHSMVQSIL